MMNYDSLFENTENTAATIDKMAVLKDGTGKHFFPVTCSTAIYDTDGISIGQKIEQLKALTGQVQSRLDEVHELASQREVIIANDEAYNKSSMLLYLASILSDGSILSNSLILASLSDTTSGLPEQIKQAELTVLKRGNKLSVFVTDSITQKEYYTTYTSSSSELIWYLYLTQPVDLNEEKQFVTKEYVDTLVAPIPDAVWKESKQYTDNTITSAKNEIRLETTDRIAKAKAEIIASIDEFVKDSITSNNSTYVTKGYLEEQLQRFKSEIGTSTDDIISKRLGDIGDLEHLETTAKDSLVSAVNEVFQSGNSFKSGIKDAVIAKDNTLEIPENPTLNDLVDAIGSIKGGMDLSDATAASDDILEGKTAYGNDGKLTGTIQTNEFGGTTITPGTANIIIPKSYNKEPVTIAGDSNLIAANIVSGKSIFGANGASKVTGLQVATGSVSPGTLVNYVRSPGSRSYYVSTNTAFVPRYVFLEISRAISDEYSGNSSKLLQGGSRNLFISNLSSGGSGYRGLNNIYEWIFSISGVSASGFYFNYRSQSTAARYYYLYLGNAMWFAFG